MTYVSAFSLKVVEENMYVIAKYGLQDEDKYVTIRKCYVLVLSRCVIEKPQGMTTVETYKVYWQNIHSLKQILYLHSFLTSVLDRVSCQLHAPPSSMRLDGPQNWSGYLERGKKFLYARRLP
jgi:hypothetical protein